MELDDKKILEHYISKRKIILQELDALNSLIEDIEWKMIIGSTLNSNTKSLSPNDIESQYERKATRNYRKRMSNYNPSFTYNEKVHFILNKIPSATVYDMRDLLLEYDKDLDKDKLFQGLTLAASSMNVKNEIYSTKAGKRNLYSLRPFFDNDNDKSEFDQEKKWIEKRNELTNDPGEM